MKTSTAILAAILLAVGSAGAAPTVLFNTFGPGDTYNTHLTNMYAHTDPPEWRSLAYQFVIGTGPSYNLDRIELAASLLIGTNTLDVWLMSDAGGGPGTTLETFDFTGAMVSPPGSILSADSVLHPVLDPGTAYWLGASPGAGVDTEVGWYDSSPPVYGTAASRFKSFPWSVHSDSQLGAFRISGSPVSSTDSIPAPGALLLGGMGVALVSWLRKRRTL